MINKPQHNIQWKTSTDEAQYDPFGLTEETPKVPLQIPTPTFTFSKNEKNKIHKEFLQEIEDSSLSLHPHLRFYQKDKLDRADLAQYSDSEIEEALRSKSQLNQEQRNAALKCHKDLYIKALAGTGKTSLLSACISRLLAQGADPLTIAISSHTVSAAEEIKSRIFPTLERLFPNTKESLGNMKPSTGTIHALAYRELNVYKHPKARWTILDETQQFRVWMEANQFAFPEKTGLKDEGAWEHMRLLDRIRSYDIPEKMVSQILEVITEQKDLRLIAETYTKIKEARKLLDYTDLLRQWAPLIIHPGYKKRWEFFFVDEFQDTNPLQKFLLKLLKFSGTTLIVCGDTRQSINSFTGSDPTSHTGFFKEIGVEETLLQTNYRCSQQIIALANQTLASMSPPEKAKLLPHDGTEPGLPIEFILTKNQTNKNQFLPPKDQQLQKTEENQISCEAAIKTLAELEDCGIQSPSVAILYRTNVQGGDLEQSLAKINTIRQTEGKSPIKFVRKDFRRTALKNKTEKELLALLSAWCEPQQANWESLLVSPYFHAVGEITARSIHKKAEKNKPKNRQETEELFVGELSKKNAETIAEFFQAWETAEMPTQKEHTEFPSPQAACVHLKKWILDAANKRTYDPGSKKEVEENQKRTYETGLFERILVKALLSSSLPAILQEIQEENEKTQSAQNHANRALGLGANQALLEKEEGIILSTIHLAKGREYDGVVLHQVSYGSLPHFNSLNFYRNPKNVKEKEFRKYSTFASLQTPPIDWESNIVSLPSLSRTEINLPLPKNEIEEWEDYNNPLEEEKRLLYVAITRAKKKLVITSRDYKYPYLHSSIWDTLKNHKKFS